MKRNKVLILALAWLIVINLFGLLALNRFNLSADNAYSWIPTERYNQNQTWNVVDMHSRWDSNWYQDIVKNGYKRDSNDTLSNLVFFPLYPLLVKMTTIFTGGNIVLAGWIVSLTFFILSCLMMFKLIKKFHKEADPFFAVFLLLIFPTAFFLNAVYTESLFLFLSLATFYYAFDRRYLLAGIIGFLAALTRVTGVLLFVPVLLHFIMTEKSNLYNLKKIWVLAFIPLGLVFFFLYHWIYFGSPFLFFEIESAWGRSFAVNKDHFTFFSRAAISNLVLDIIYLIFSLGVAGYLLKLKKYPYAIYMISTIGVAVLSGTLMSIGRYILVLFPIFIIGASIKNETVKYIWILISSMLMALNTYLFVNWYWAG